MHHSRVQSAELQAVESLLLDSGLCAVTRHLRLAAFILGLQPSQPLGEDNKAGMGFQSFGRSWERECLCVGSREDFDTLPSPLPCSIVLLVQLTLECGLSEHQSLT